MKIIKPSVKLILPKNINGDEYLKIIEEAGRTCYKSEDKITDTSAPEFVKMLLKNGHEAMIEHGPDISMRFICDRGVSHEIVRHRLFSFAQESTRYCNYVRNEMTFILPCWFNHIESRTLLEGDIVDYIIGNHPITTWVNLILDSEKAYTELLLKGWTPQQARSVLPNSLKTEIVVKGNPREWRHFFKLRTAKDAHPQMQEVANMALDIVCDYIPILFDEFKKEK